MPTRLLTFLLAGLFTGGFGISASLRPVHGLPGYDKSALAPDNVETLSKVDSLVKQGAFIKARIAIEKLLEQYPDDLKARLLAARLYKEMGLWSRAIIDYEIVREREPGFAEPYIALSQMHLENLSSDLALSMAKQALRLSPDSREARGALISALIASHEYREADRQLALLLKSFPSDPQVLFIAFQLNRDNGEFKQARVYLEKAIARKRLQISWLLDLFDLLESMGDIPAARRTIEVYLSKAPNSVEALERLALLQERYLFDYVSAGKTYDKILSIDSENWNALAGKDRIKVRRNDVAMTFKRSVRHLWRQFMEWLDSLINGQ